LVCAKLKYKKEQARPSPWLKTDVCIYEDGKYLLSQ